MADIPMPPTPPKRYGAASSSVDPQQLSLTIQSGAKTVIGIVGVIAALAGLPPKEAADTTTTVVDAIAAAVPAAYAAYHAVEAVYGLVRKIIVAMFGSRPAA
jgi:uncharacterized integral membrane protein